MTATMRGFIAISVMLHAGAIAALYGPLPDAGTASPSLRVSIIRPQLESPSSAASSAAPAPQEAKVPAKSEHANVPGPMPVKTRRVKPAKPVAANNTAAPRKPSKNRSDTLRQLTREAQNTSDRMFVGIQRPSATQPEEAGNVLHRLFAAHFHYPLLARRRGWQGEVRLGLRLEPDGRLTHIRIVQSSGFPVLDKSAIKTARKVERAPDAVRWLQGERLDMVLPVQYRLNGS